MAAEVEVPELPQCDMCKTKPAAYDAKTIFGWWAYLCDDDWVIYRISSALGTGFGQHLVAMAK